MILLESIALSDSDIQIGRAEPEDMEAVLAVFDDTLAWMVAQGNVKQWGTTPFSQLPRMVDRFRKHLGEDTVFAALKEGAVVGVIVVSFSPPPYCWHDTKEQSAYIEPFATTSSVRGAKVGHLLLKKAAEYAVRQGMLRLRLDCFAENPKLPAYYEGAGFVPRGEFTVGNWHGRMYEQILTATDSIPTLKPCDS